MIKYRVYNKLLGFYLRPELTRIDGNGNLYVNDAPANPELFDVEKWIGASDVKGKDIYEADILIDEDDKYAPEITVKFQPNESEFMGVDEYGTRWPICYPNTYEVIGNTHG